MTAVSTIGSGKHGTYCQNPRCSFPFLSLEGSAGEHWGGRGEPSWMTLFKGLEKEDFEFPGGPGVKDPALSPLWL